MRSPRQISAVSPRRVQVRVSLVHRLQDGVIRRRLAVNSPSISAMTISQCWGFSALFYPLRIFANLFTEKMLRPCCKSKNNQRMPKQKKGITPALSFCNILISSAFHPEGGNHVTRLQKHSPVLRRSRGQQ